MLTYLGISGANQGPPENHRTSLQYGTEGVVPSLRREAGASRMSMMKIKLHSGIDLTSPHKLFIEDTMKDKLIQNRKIYK